MSKDKFKIKYSDIFLFILWFSVFPFQLPGKITYILQFIFGILIFYQSLPEIKKISNVLYIFLFPTAIILSCMINRNLILFTQVMRGLTYAILVIDLFLFLRKYIKKNGKNTLLKKLYFFSKIYFIISSVWIFVLFLGNRIENSTEGLNLFLGGKFNTAYSIIIFLILFDISWNGNGLSSVLRKRVIFLFLSIIGIVICYLLQVSTGIVAIAFLAIMILIPNNFYKIVNNSVILTSFVLISMIVVFVISAVLEHPFIQNIIVNVLHENLTLTGRTELYQLLLPLLLEVDLWGGGFGSYSAMQLGYHGWFNAQNGLSEIILTYGYFGGATFLATVFYSAKNNKSDYKALNAGILVFIIIAIIEVPFDARFIFLLALYWVVGVDFNSSMISEETMSF